MANVKQVTRIFALVRRLWMRSPTLRFGQLLNNFSNFLASQRPSLNFSEISDDDVETYLTLFEKKWFGE